MQVFLPYESFVQTAQCLDRARLGSQRREALLAIDTSIRVNLVEDNGKRVGWANHPTRLMWADHLWLLCEYGKVICDEWLRRGYVDSTKTLFEQRQLMFDPKPYPSWLGNESFHQSHRSNLIRKGEERLLKTGKSDILDRYRSLWPDTPSDLPYIWPVRKNKPKITFAQA